MEFEMQMRKYWVDFETQMRKCCQVETLLEMT